MRQTGRPREMLSSRPADRTRAGGAADRCAYQMR
jgi:hypothetical protein